MSNENNNLASISNTIGGVAGASAARRSPAGSDPTPRRQSPTLHKHCIGRPHKNSPENRNGTNCPVSIPSRSDAKSPVSLPSRSDAKSQSDARSPVSTKSLPRHNSAKNLNAPKHSAVGETWISTKDDLNSAYDVNSLSRI